jgi:hypothetical protein
VISSGSDRGRPLQRATWRDPARFVAAAARSSDRPLLRRCALVRGGRRPRPRDAPLRARRAVGALVARGDGRVLRRSHRRRRRRAPRARSSRSGSPRARPRVVLRELRLADDARGVGRGAHRVRHRAADPSAPRALGRGDSSPRRSATRFRRPAGVDSSAAPDGGGDVAARLFRVRSARHSSLASERRLDVGVRAVRPAALAGAGAGVARCGHAPSSTGWPRASSSRSPPSCSH